jgi:hypothetical protein
MADVYISEVGVTLLPINNTHNFGSLYGDEFSKTIQISFRLFIMERQITSDE